MNNTIINVQNSKASQEIINEYRLCDYDSDKNEFIDTQGIYSPSFPVVIKSDGTVWETAALYLNYLLIQKRRSSKLLKTVACDLLDFLRFMEANDIGMLHLPDEQELRISYRYRQDLLYRKELSRNTVSQRINRIVDFYKFCFEEKLFTNSELNNRVYKKLKVQLMFFSDHGFKISVDKDTTDLAIKRSPRSNAKSDSISDGRQLHPLTKDEQDIFEGYLRNHGSRIFQLICSIAINTGARTQPICTLRVNDIKGLMKSRVVKGHLKQLKIGGGTNIDNKNSKQYSIFFPIWLVEDLNAYISSEEWRERASKSYYKNENNYVFLSKFGSSLYTSKQEVEDRRLRVFPTNGKFVEKAGESVRKYLNDLWEIILEDGAEIRKFSIHDLRATFGLNLLNSLENSNLTQNLIIDEIRERMGHSNRNVTLNYLNYNARNKAYMRVNEEYSQIIYRFD